MFFECWDTSVSLLVEIFGIWSLILIFKFLLGCPMCDYSCPITPIIVVCQIASNRVLII